jgi:hypothetical protein
MLYFSSSLNSSKEGRERDLKNYRRACGEPAFKNSCNLMAAKEVYV